MAAAESAESGAGEGARCCRLLTAAPSGQRGRPPGADSGPTPELLPSVPAPRAPAAGVASPRPGLTSPARPVLSTRRSAGFWRPWVDPRGDNEDAAPLRAAAAVPDSPGVTEISRKLSQYRHPVKLFWPKSKCYDYLYQEAEALLKSFPIQATISFYEDSDSEDEIGELTCDLEN
ncbi:protein ripply2 [Tenrec ecaudatus]|uniref:protein ripply2 n=1 Tax=Tenrec ecaudatus TaxID=94439 RepID=UPI003F59F3A1